MKTQKAIELAGGTTKELAGLLGITSGAVSQWGEDVPESRIWQLQVIRPKWFGTTGNTIKPDRRSGKDRRVSKAA